FTRIGFGIQGKYEDLAVRGGYIFGRNNNPYGALNSDTVDSTAWFVETEYFLFAWLIPYLRYEGLTVDLPSGVEGIDSSQDRERVVLGAKALIRANISLSVEGRFHTKNQATGGRGDADQVVVQLEAAF
ncbi:MAG: hypothetical protein QGD94_07570, partial [Planctomycetia bacterium]|nr:hypothetical protein [Planctomycetia bacterium]